MPTTQSITKSAQPPGWDVLVKIDPMTLLTPAQANAYLSPLERDLEYATDGQPDFIPYEVTSPRQRLALTACRPSTCASTWENAR